MDTYTGRSNMKILKVRKRKDGKIEWLADAATDTWYTVHPTRIADVVNKGYVQLEWIECSAK